MNERCADSELLRAFARDGDQRALAEVIRRHLDLVYGTALRKVADVGAAEEISQNVFTVLARKAWQFAPDSSLPAWLHKTTLLESKSWLRCEVRRRQRERAAVELSTTMKIPDQESTFGALMPLLDEALLSLREPDRTALLLRYCENQSLREVGAALGVNEDVAQKRVASALQRLAAFFQRRGFKTATLATTAAALKEAAVSACPATASNVTKSASRVTPLTFAGLFALLIGFMSLTRMEKAMVFLFVGVVFVAWFWKPKVEQELAPSRVDLGQTAVARRRSNDRKLRESAVRSEGTQPDQQDSESAQTPRYVKITAEIEQFSYPSGDTNNPVNVGLDSSVVCITSANEWRIDPSFGQSGTSQWFFDGTNIYENNVVIQGPSNQSRSVSQSDSAAQTNSSVHIHASRGGCAVGGTRLNITWLAFCSGAYLKREGRLIPLPVVPSLGVAPDGFAYSDTTQTFDDELGLPQTVDLFASDSLFPASVTNGVFKGKRDVELWKRGSTGFKWDFPDGALKFHYAVTESTNFWGWSFPVAFEWFLNMHEEGKLFTRFGGRGKVTSIRASRRPESVIVPGARNQTIMDWRFSDAGVLDEFDGPISYTTTNALAAPMNGAMLQEKFTERASRMKGMKRGP